MSEPKKPTWFFRWANCYKVHRAMLIIENIAILNGYLKKIGSDSEFPRGRLQPSRWAERAFCGKKKHKANKPIRSMGYCKRSLIRHGRSCRNGYFLSGNKNIATHQSELRYCLRQLAAGVPGRIRTSGLRSRSPALYPAELRVHILLLLPDYTLLSSQNQERLHAFFEKRWRIAGIRV